MKYHLIPIRMAIIKKSIMLERVWRKGNPPTLLVGMEIGTATVEHSMEMLLPQCSSFLLGKRLKTELPCDSAIPLLHVTRGNNSSERCVRPALTAACLQQPGQGSSQVSINRGMDTDTDTHTMECYSAIKRNETTSFAATGVDLETIILTEVNQKERSISHNITCMLNLKKWYKWTYLQDRNRLSDTENRLMVTKGEEERGKFGSWD